MTNVSSAAPAPEPAGEYLSDAEYSRPIPESVFIDREQTVRVVVLDKPVENNFTEKDLRIWSLGFSRPTVIKNCFTPPDLSGKDVDKCEFFLPKNTKMHANVGKIGHFQDGNGTYSWSQLWELMKEGKNVYGSWGTATNNGGMDWGNECLNANSFTKSINAMREKYMPAGMGKCNDYPGHVIFGCSETLKVSSNWHNAIDANLLFQLYGNKEWYTCENLPKGFTSYPVVTHANAVVPDEMRLEESPSAPRLESKVTRALSTVFPQAAHVTLEAGDMLINPPFSWHAIKVDQMSISLSLRGDKQDVIMWLAHRYFNGDVDHPLLLCFSHLFFEYNYVKFKWSSWNILYNAGQYALLKMVESSQDAKIKAQKYMAKKLLDIRLSVQEYCDKYE